METKEALKIRRREVLAAVKDLFAKMNYPVEMVPKKKLK